MLFRSGLRETALLRQGLLSEPQASSGPAAMLLAVSRSPSSIPRRSPCLERCHLPLAFLYTSTSQNLKNIPDCIYSRTNASFLWRSSTTSTSQNLKNTPNCIHSRSDASFLWRPSTTSTSQNLKKHSRLHPMLKADVKKNLSHRHETPIFSFSGLPKKNKIYYTY